MTNTVMEESFYIYACDNGYELVNDEVQQFRVKLTPTQAEIIRREMRTCTYSPEPIKLKVSIENLFGSVSLKIEDENPCNMQIITDQYYIHRIIGKRGAIRHTNETLFINKF